MDPTAQVLDKVRKALASEPRLDLRRFPFSLAFDGAVLTMAGEVRDIAAKKLALEHAAAIPEVAGIVDRVRVKPAQEMGDREIRDHLANAFQGEPALADLTLIARDGAQAVVLHRPDEAPGRIEFSVADGVVTLDGQVPTLARKRLAGVLAWWVPGSREVVNGMAVEPPEADSPDAIEDAVALVLERDPFVDASQIRVGVRHAVVHLTGLVPSVSEREMAEFDAWYVFGVDNVINDIEVRA
jgi:osmotically-inducible protein OsmY